MDPQVLAEVRRLTASEDEDLVRTRARAGADAPSPEVGALLAWLASTTAARAAVEVGSCGGVSGLWLARGLTERGVLTSVEPDPYAHGLASEAFESAGRADRVRAILGEPDTVLPRLSDGAYDLVLLQSRPGDYPDQLPHARRLLRAGGVLVARRVLRHGEAPDALAGFLEALATDHDGFATTVLPLDDGLALATRRAEGDGGPDAAAAS
jgi:predicted O-methyltransferase YrrM